LTPGAAAHASFAAASVGTARNVCGLARVGTEYALRDNWSVKVEYNRLEFDPGTIDVVKAGVNYRFGLDPRRY
jgi:hypothetical protein